MDNNFENSIKNKVEQFDETPSEKIWVDISQKIKTDDLKNVSKNTAWKTWGILIVGVVILLGIYWKYNSAPAENIPPNQERQANARQVISEGIGETADALFPTELIQALDENKGLMAYVCMENCKYCTKLVNETLSQPEVHDFLEERFVQVAVDLRAKGNRSFLEKYETKAAPTVLFFDAKGQFINKSEGAVAKEIFMDTASEAWELINAGEASDAKPLDMKVSPNPSNGNFKIQLDGLGQSSLVSIVSEKGQEVYSRKIDASIDYFEDNITLDRHPKGIYYLRVMQNEKVHTEKIIVQ